MATLTPRSTPAYVVDGLNQYTSVGSQNIGYDLNGNLTSDGAFAFAYDPENRLMRAAKTGTSATYAYDPLGRRTTKTVNGTATYFLVSGDDEIAEYDGGGNLLRRYVPGPGVDQPIAMVTAAGARSFFHQDKTGSVVAMTDSTGAITEGPYTYDPFGNGAPTTGVPYKYTGRRLDPETGLYYYRARYYSPAIGRFLQTDPVGYKDDVDWYTYVGNDPTDRTDPSGLYGRGSGFDDDQWKRFDRNQQKAANKMESKAQKMEQKAKALDAKGDPGGAALHAEASTITNGVAALRSDGSAEQGGFVANLVDQKTYESLGGSAKGAALTSPDGKTVNLNGGNSVAWSDPVQVQWTIGHESLHSAGLKDQVGPSGARAYKFGSPPQQKAFKDIRGTPTGAINPDSIMEEVYGQ